MKDGKFEVGDEVECVDGGKMEITNGKKYIIEKETTCEGCINIRDDTGVVRSYFYSRFKPTFQHEYFSALNEKDASPYIGKVMEFADSTSVKRNNWEKCIFKGFYNTDTNWTFNSKHNFWQFMRTCPETFQKKKVKKTVECWANIYPIGDPLFHTAKEFADKCQGKLDKRIACVKLTGEYEVEE